MEGTEQKPVQDSVLSALLPALRRLDLLLEAAVRNVQSSGPGSAVQGLFISRDQVDRLLAESPGQMRFQLLGSNEESTNAPAEASSLSSLVQSLSLNGFEGDVLLVALAPEIDLRYERIYAYIHDDVTRKRPTIDLALNLLCRTAEDKIICRSLFSPSAPLVRNRLIQVNHDSNQLEPSSLAQSFRLDDQIRRLLLGQSGLDERIVSFSSLIEPTVEWNDGSLNSDVKQMLPELVRDSLSTRKPLRLYFQGAAHAERQEAAEGLARMFGVSLLSVRVNRIPENMDSDLIWSLVTREAQIHRAFLLISDLDEFHGSDTLTQKRDLLDGLARHPGVTILAGRTAKELRSVAPFGIVAVDFSAPDFDERLERWKKELSSGSSSVSPPDLEMLASRFRLTPLRISRAVAAAELAARWRQLQSGSGDPSHSSAPSISTEELAAAARSQCGTELSNLAPKIEPRYEWGDLILPSDAKAQLREICSHAEFRHVVYSKWGFGRKLSLGKGLNVLFTGPPGTGKTMAAEVMARELCLDLYRIDLSRVVSKYIGETEKNLDRIFTAAEDSNAILFFDEADALFGKRSEVRDSHDRYANIEISYLLQKMEEYQGISILATNLRQNIDEAFLRRLQSIVEFPFPDEEYRLQIWRNVFPKEAPLDNDVRFDLLAREVQLAGGNIKNMALAASFYAASSGERIQLSHLVHAAYREYQKLARSWDPSESLRAALPDTEADGESQALELTVR